MCIQANAAKKKITIVKKRKKSSSRNKIDYASSNLAFPPSHKAQCPALPLLEYRVSFNDLVTVRNYPTVLGDHPSVSHGPPVSIGWDYTTTHELRPGNNLTEGSSRTNMYLDPPSRIARLLNNGVSHQSMNDAVTEIRSIQRQRNMTKAEHKWQRRLELKWQQRLRRRKQGQRTRKKENDSKTLQRFQSLARVSSLSSVPAVVSTRIPRLKSGLLGAAGLTAAREGTPTANARFPPPPTILGGALRNAITSNKKRITQPLRGGRLFIL